MPSIYDLGPLNATLIEQLLESPRTRHTLNLPGATMLAECSQVLESQLVQFMETMRGVESPHDGYCIQFGWTHVILKQAGEAFRAEEPDLNGNPYQDMRKDITLTLLIAAWQALVCRRVGAVGPDLTWQSKLVVAGDALEQPDVFMKREVGIDGQESCWYVGPLEKPGRTLTPTVMTGWELWQKRPALVTTLCLPPEYLVVFDGDTIRGIADPHDNEVWSPP